MERSNEEILQNTTPENVMRYLSEKLKAIHNTGEGVVNETFDDGTIRQYSFYVYPIHSNRIEITYSTATTPKGDIQKMYGSWNMYPAMSFEALPLQTNTALIKGKCERPLFAPIFDKYWDDMLNAFGAVRPSEDGEDVEIIIEKPSKEFQEKVRRAKPVLDAIQTMDKHPVYGAVVDLLGNKSLKTVIEQGGKNLEERLAKSAKELPLPRDAGQVGAGDHFNSGAYMNRQILRQLDIEDEKKYQEELNTLRQKRNELEVDAGKPKKPNAQINQRAMIWRDLQGWMKLGNVTPTPKDCIKELKKKSAYRDKKISTKRMQIILNEGFEGKYKDILKNV